MISHLLVTAVGQDRPGIVARLTEVLVSHGCNLEESRMAILGGEFAAIMLVTGRVDMAALEKDLTRLERDGISVSTKVTQPSSPEKYKNYTSCEIFLRGADHEGIVHALSRQLSEMDINIQSMHTEVISAPVSAAPLFSMNATVLVPPSLSIGNLERELSGIADMESVDIELKIRTETHEPQDARSKR